MKIVLAICALLLAGAVFGHLRTVSNIEAACDESGVVAIGARAFVCVPVRMPGPESPAPARSRAHSI